MPYAKPVSYKRMTIAEPTEPLTFPHLDSTMNKQNLQDIVGPAARHWCPLVSIRGSISIILAATWPLHIVYNPQINQQLHSAEGGGDVEYAGVPAEGVVSFHDIREIPMGGMRPSAIWPGGIRPG